MYLRVLWIIPGLVLLGIGLWNYLGTPDDGTVTSVHLTTKSGLVGEAAEAVRLVQLSQPDLYITVNESDHVYKGEIFSHTPVGNGLAWPLPKHVAVRKIREVEVWDHHTVLSDKMQDRVSLNSGKPEAPAIWDADGQTFHIELWGARVVPPMWAMPMIIAGGVICGIVVLRFVWDQAL
jgi:hypothetical protein